MKSILWGVASLVLPPILVETSILIFNAYYKIATSWLQISDNATNGVQGDAFMFALFSTFGCFIMVLLFLGWISPSNEGEVKA